MRKWRLEVRILPSVKKMPKCEKGIKKTVCPTDKFFQILLLREDNSIENYLKVVNYIAENLGIKPAYIWEIIYLNDGQTRRDPTQPSLKLQPVNTFSRWKGIKRRPKCSRLES